MQINRSFFTIFFTPAIKVLPIVSGKTVSSNFIRNWIWSSSTEAMQANWMQKVNGGSFARGEIIEEAAGGKCQLKFAR